MAKLAKNHHYTKGNICSDFRQEEISNKNPAFGKKIHIRFPNLLPAGSLSVLQADRFWRKRPGARVSQAL
ncbi:hypothetical protein LL912_03540 [Niabella sp. CC-SYL272]|uniref:hypothetical protein n=1 Tax=Niabella agricola TaxID=2891571 RepID=UPI001F1E04F6|nr:hypothetical protein [Niabella agricola]MCF3107844.1 hypothetical protein [Niabella agricola]